MRRRSLVLFRGEAHVIDRADDGTDYRQCRAGFRLQVLVGLLWLLGLPLLLWLLVWLPL